VIKGEDKRNGGWGAGVSEGSREFESKRELRILK
jgi:hypothetical protein